MIVRVLGLAAALFAVWAPTASAQTSVNEAARSTVRVAIIMETPSGRMLYGTGSGFVVAPNLVITNAHVVAAARQQPSFGVAIVPSQGEGLIAARIVRYSPLTDLALLEFRGGDDLLPVTLSTLTPHAGDAIVALGYPDVDDLQRPADELVQPTPPSRTLGSIASLRERAPTGDPIPTINHAAAISSGSSGGPLLDECGRVIGVNTWHARGTDTLESRGVATRINQLIDFLADSGITPRLTDERCLSFAERVEAERVATVDALETQNRQLAAKLETADRLTRVAIVVLIGGTLALFVAVCVLGALLLSRRRRDAHPQAEHEADHPHAPHKRSALGVAAVIGGACVAAVLVVAVGIVLLRMRAESEGRSAALSRFSGAISCSLNAAMSSNPGDASDTEISISGEMCVNGRTLYAPTADGRRYRRAVLPTGESALDILTLDPEHGEYRRERYKLSQSALAAASEAAGPPPADGCEATGARDAVGRRNEVLIRFAEGQPTQRLVWECRPETPATN